MPYWGTLYWGAWAINFWTPTLITNVTWRTYREVNILLLRNETSTHTRNKNHKNEKRCRYIYLHLYHPFHVCVLYGMPTILVLSSQVSIVDICWAHTAVGSSFAVVYIVSPFPEHYVYWTCGMEFQKLFSSCMLLKKLGLLDRVTKACLVWVLTSYNHSVHISMADSPLAAESRSTPLNNQSPSANRAFLFLTVFQVSVTLVPAILSF